MSILYQPLGPCWGSTCHETIDVQDRHPAVVLSLARFDMCHSAHSGGTGSSWPPPSPGMEPKAGGRVERGDSPLGLFDRKLMKTYYENIMEPTKASGLESFFQTTQRHKTGFRSNHVWLQVEGFFGPESG